VRPADFGLPFTSWRHGQKEAIERVIASGAEVVLLEAPPGIGKTAVAVALARAMDDPPTAILTGTKQLQDQYMGLPGLVQVRGRNNFPCLIEPQVTADAAACTVGAKCEYAGKNGSYGCSYWTQRKAAMTAEEVVTNYAYYLLQPVGAFMSPKMLVCDEAHSVRQQLEQTITLPLREAHIINAALKQMDFGDGPTTLGQIHAWSQRILPVLQKLDTAVQARQWKAGEMPSDERKFRAAVTGLIRVAVSVIDDPDNWVVSRELWGWELRPIWVRGFFKHFIEKTQMALFMSATILDPQLYLQSLGLEDKTWEYIRFDSPFPVANRPLIYWPVSKVSGRDPGSYQAIVGAVDRLMEEHPGEKGLVHTVNYSLAQAILKGSRHSGRMMIHDSGNREATLEAYKKSTKPMVLVSPSMGVGVDLPYDLVRWQAICKLPFPDTTDPQRLAQAKEPLGKKLSMYDTATTLVQMYGRAVRAEDDYGITYLLDSNFGGWFRSATKHLLPKYFTEAITNR